MMKSPLTSFFALLLVFFCLNESVAQQVEGKSAKDEEAPQRAERNREAVSCQLRHLAELAQQHYSRPAELGGGSDSFDGSSRAGHASAWTIPGELDTTANGIYVISLSRDVVTIVGIGMENGADSEFLNANRQTGKVQVICIVASQTATIAKEN